MHSKLTLFLLILSTFSVMPIISMAHQDDIARRAGKTFITKAAADAIHGTDVLGEEARRIQNRLASKDLRKFVLGIGYYGLIGNSLLGLITNCYRSLVPYSKMGLRNQPIYRKLLPKKIIIGLAVAGSGIVGATHLFTSSENFVDKTIGWNIYNRISHFRNRIFQFEKRYIIGNFDEPRPEDRYDYENKKYIKIEPWGGIISSCINYFKGTSSHENP